MSLFGLFGDDDSSSHTTSNSTANNTAYETDRRAVASENAVSLTGDNNSIDRSQTTNFFDTSDRSSTSLTSFIDNSDRSTNFQDNSNRSVTTTTTATDFGSVNGALGLNGAMTTAAFGLAGGTIGGAIDILKLQSDNSQKAVMAAFDMAKSTSMANSAAVLGFASNAIGQTNDAFAQAKDSGQSKMVTYAVIGLAVVGVAFAMKN